MDTPRQPGELVEALYRARLAGDPDREAIWTPSGSCSHGELGQWIAAQREALAAVQPLLPPGRLCGTLCGNHRENLALSMALLFAGIPQTLLPTHAGPEELAHTIRRCGFDRIASDRPLPESLGMVRLARLDQGMALWGPASACDEAPSPGAGDEDLEALLRRPTGVGLTSGTTTGIPAVVPSSYFRCLASLQQPVWPPTRRMVMTFALQFGASRGWALRVLLEGGTLCAVPEEQMEHLPRLAGDAGADGYCANPPRLLHLLEQGAERFFPAALTFMTGSDRVPAPLRQRFLDRFGPRLWVLYASSQSGPLSRLPPERLLVHDGESIGTPLEGVSFALEPLAGAGEPLTGEVVVRKLWRLRLRHPRRGELLLEEAQQHFRPRDLLRRWPDGSYSFAGRADDVFLFRSVLISPHEIENLLSADPAVAEVVAFGASSSTYGAVPMAVVILRQGRDPAEDLPRLRRLAQQAMGFRAPKAVIAVEEIPRGPGGKPLRRVLAERHALS